MKRTIRQWKAAEIRALEKRIRALSRRKPQPSFRTIAEQLKEEGMEVSYATVARILAEVPRYGRRKDPITVSERKEILRRYKNGEAIKTIARALERSYDKVKAAITEAGLEVRGGTVPTTKALERGQLVLEWRNLGYSYSEIGKDLDPPIKSRQGVQRIYDQAVGWEAEGLIHVE